MTGTRIYLTSGAWFEVTATPDDVAKQLAAGAGPAAKFTLVAFSAIAGGQVLINPAYVQAIHQLPGQPPEGPVTS